MSEALKDPAHGKEDLGSKIEGLEGLPHGIEDLGA